MIPLNQLKDKKFKKAGERVELLPWIPVPEYSDYADKNGEVTETILTEYKEDLKASDAHLAACAATRFPLCGELPQKESYVLDIDFEVKEGWLDSKGNFYRTFQELPKVLQTGLAHATKDWVAVPLSPKEETKTTAQERESPLCAQMEIKCAASAYADKMVPDAHKHNAPYYTTLDKWEDVKDAFEAGYKAALSPVREEREEKAEAEMKYKDYPTAARAIAVWLQPFCDRELPYTDMIVDAAQKANKRIEELEEVLSHFANDESFMVYDAVDSHFKDLRSLAKLILTRCPS